MAFEFDPTYELDDSKNVAAVTHNRARVKSDSPELGGLEVEIRGTTTDGRRLCVSDAGDEAWLSVEQLEKL